MNNADRKAQADRILYEFGLWNRIEEIGRAHIVGSYRMNMMVWNDLDIDIENNTMSLDKMYEFKVSHKNTDRERILTYGPMSYCYRILNEEAYADKTDLKNVVSALYYFNEAANNYVR